MSARRPLVIFGTGDLAEVAKFYFEHDSAWRPVAFAVDRSFLKETMFAGLPVVPFEKVTAAFPPETHDLFVALGYGRINAVRTDKCIAARALGYRLACYVSSKATTWPGLVVGDNAFILEDNTIQPFVRIGDGVVCWSGNHIGHHATIGDYAFLSSHIVVSGGVAIGERCFIGVNATIRDHVTIGARSVIGAGALIAGNVEPDSVYRAAPAEKSPVPSHRLRHL